MNVCVQFITNFNTWRYLIRTHCGVHLFRILARNMRAQVGPQHPATFIVRRTPVGDRRVTVSCLSIGRLCGTPNDHCVCRSLTYVFFR